jgi:hypothetical protein
MLDPPPEMKTAMFFFLLFSFCCCFVASSSHHHLHLNHRRFPMSVEQQKRGETEIFFDDDEKMKKDDFDDESIENNDHHLSPDFGGSTMCTTRRRRKTFLRADFEFIMALRQRKRPAVGFFFLFSSKKVFVLFRETVTQTVEKNEKKDHLRSTSSSHQRSRLKNNKHLLFLPSSRISSTTTNTFAENNEPFFVVHSLVVRSVLPLVVNYTRLVYTQSAVEISFENTSSLRGGDHLSCSCSS